jgi:hypothetical protein
MGYSKGFVPIVQFYFCFDRKIIKCSWHFFVQYWNTRIENVNKFNSQTGQDKVKKTFKKCKATRSYGNETACNF